MIRFLLPAAVVLAMVAPGEQAPMPSPPAVIAGMGQEPTLRMDLQLEGISPAIALMGFSMNVEHSGGQGAAPRFRDFHLIKQVDATSPALFTACVSARPIPIAVIVLRREGEQAREFMRYTLRRVRIKSIAAGADIGGALTEQINLDFERIELRYTPPGRDAVPLESSWDKTSGAGP